MGLRPRLLALAAARPVPPSDHQLRGNTMTGPSIADLDVAPERVRSVARFALVLAMLVLSFGCNRMEPLSGATEMDQATCSFDIYWPPRDPEEAVPPSGKPLLKGRLAVNTQELPQGRSELRLVVTITRPSEEADRKHWNSELAFADIAWMREVRVWDAEDQWLWPNLPYLLRLPGQERVERYGGMDPAKHVDNDFAAVLIRKYDASGMEESAETKDAPLVSAEWHPMGAASTDLHSVVHEARSDEFVLHLGGKAEPVRGRVKMWVIYADFFGAKAPRTWPKDREFAGGILAYMEIDWETSPEGRCQGVVRQKRPQAGTAFNWARWVVRGLLPDQSKAQVRLSDLATEDGS